MNNQLSEHPFGELIREISAKSLSGKLQLQQDRIKVVVYFTKGNLLYAAANLRAFRLREYLQKSELITEAQLARFDERQSDLELAKSLSTEQLLAASTAEQIQTKQVSDVLRLPLLWTEGLWEFDPRSQLSEVPQLKLDVNLLLLEASRRLPPEFAASRFPDLGETLSPLAALGSAHLLPAEVFLFSRLDGPMTARELVAVSGLGETETLRLAYSLTVAGLVQREEWPSAFGDPAVKRRPPKQTTPLEVTTREEQAPVEPEDDLESFLERLKNAQSHYDVLGAGRDASPAYLKTKYYELARRYHPDRFRKAEASLLKRLESAFARITQAYETLRDERLRSSYDRKLRARQKAEQNAGEAPKAAAPETAFEPGVSDAERAANNFKEGLAALELGQRKVALSLFASAARAVPGEARYRASYGRMLAENENTRRAAEAEIQAAIKLDPNNTEYRVLLAELYRDLGLLLRARGEAERALAADPNNQKARDLLRALKSV